MSKNLSRGVAGVLTLVSGAGTWFAVELTRHKYANLCKGPVDSWCNVDATFDCSSVSASAWSEIAGIPVSVPGIGFFVMAFVLCLWAATVASDEDRKRISGVLFGVSLPALAFGLYLMAVMHFQLEKYCLQCMALDACTLAMLLGSPFIGEGGVGGAWKEALAGLGKLTTRVPATALAVMLVGGFVGGSAYNRAVASDCPRQAHQRLTRRPSGDDDGANGGEQDGPSEADLANARQLVIDFLAVHHRNRNEVDLGLTGSEARKGASDPLVTVLEFADFQCPYCQLASFAMKDIVDRYNDWVRIIFKHYPLSQQCNPELSRDLHPQACLAAVAADCAGLQGRFWEMHDALFINNQNLARNRLLAIAGDIGVDPGALDQCLDDPAMLEWLVNDVANSRDNLGIRGTPTFFINNMPVDGAHPLKLEAAIRYELELAGVVNLPADEYGIFPEAGSTVSSAAAHEPPPPRDPHAGHNH